MRLGDLLVNTGNNVKQGVSSLFNRLMHVNEPTLPVLQMTDNGGIDLQKSFELSMAQPKTPKENLLGRTFTINSESINPETNELEISRISKFQPGLFNDISAGAKENFVTGFAAPNWEQDKTADGRQKGLGYRIGEGLGTFGRFAESPLGRGLLMAGIVGASGGSGLEALAYGGGAGMLNQQNRTADKLYRQALESQGVDTSKINGYINGDLFKNYSLNSYRNRNLDTKLYLGQLSDNTKRAQLVNTMLNNGELDPVQAMQLMNEFGMHVGQLDTSNQTKLLPYKQFALQNGWNLGWANFGMKQEAANIKNEILKELVGDNKSPNGQKVRVKSPKGVTGTIPIEQLENALAAGYTRI